MAKYRGAEAVKIESLIFTVRGQRVMLDSHLAKIYGVTTGALNQALKRNSGRFPHDFVFQLTTEESECLMSQSVISKVGRGGRRKPIRALTEHGALMLASVLKSPVAVEASIRVVRAFVLMREQLAAHRELAGNLAELEERVSGHDEAIENLFAAIRHLLEPPAKAACEIGFHVRETAPPYRVRPTRYR